MSHDSARFVVRTLHEMVAECRRECLALQHMVESARSGGVDLYPEIVSKIHVLILKRHRRPPLLFLVLDALGICDTTSWRQLQSCHPFLASPTKRIVEVLDLRIPPIIHTRYTRKWNIRHLLLVMQGDGAKPFEQVARRELQGEIARAYDSPVVRSLIVELAELILSTARTVFDYITSEQIDRADDAYRRQVFGRLLSSNPHDRRLLLDRAELCLLNGSLIRCRRDVERVLASHPSDPTALIFLAHLEAINGRQSSGLRIVSRITLDSVRDVLEALDLARHALAFGFHEFALRSLEQASRLAAHGHMSVRFDSKYDVLREDERLRERFERLKQRLSG